MNIRFSTPFLKVQIWKSEAITHKPLCADHMINHVTDFSFFTFQISISACQKSYAAFHDLQYVLPNKQAYKCAIFLFLTIVFALYGSMKTHLCFNSMQQRDNREFLFIPLSAMFCYPGSQMQKSRLPGKVPLMICVTDISQFKDLIFPVSQILGQFGDSERYCPVYCLLLHPGRWNDALRPCKWPPIWCPAAASPF